jgi:hypothetical protein
MHIQSIAIILVLCLAYYADSALVGALNMKVLTLYGVHPSVLTCGHLLVSVFLDFCAMRLCPRGGSAASALEQVTRIADRARRSKKALIPVASLITLGKIATFVSYKVVSVAYVQVAKVSFWFQYWVA